MYKGQTVIELENVHTQEKEIIKEENLVTNAVADIFRYNPSGLLYPMGQSSSGRFDQEIFPIANNCFGGILLFEEALVEDPNEYFASTLNPIIGYASNDVSATENPKRGSLNQTESIILDNGYRFVWDFSTSQGNGRISSLALTHYQGGKAYYGDAEASSNSFIQLSRHSKNLSVEDAELFIGMVEADPATNTFVSIVHKSDKSIDIVKVYEPLLSIGLNDTVVSLSPQVIERKTLNLTEFYKGVSYTNYPGFYDGQDGYYYGVAIQTDSKNNKTILNRLKINKEDYTLSNDSWNLEGVLMYSPGTYGRTNTGHLTRSICSLLDKGYLYVPSSDLTLIYKMNINNPVDISQIELGFKSSFTSGTDTRMYIYKWGKFIRGYDFLIDEKDRVYPVKGEGLSHISTPLIEIGPYRLGYYLSTSFSSSIFHKTLYLHTPYLGTINNLSTPVLKTADKTMKITYTLTEVEESV